MKVELFANDSTKSYGNPSTLITPTNMIVVTSMWLFTYWIMTFVLRKLMSSPDFFLHSSARQDDSLKRKQKILRAGPSYCASTIHAFIMSIRGLFHFFQLLYTVPIFKMQRIHANSILTHAAITAADYRHISKAQVSVETSNLVFIGFLACDLIHVIASFPKLGGLDTVTHHVLFMVVAFINGYYTIFIFPFSWLIMGEASTIFLNVRWFLIQTGRGSTNLMRRCNYIFATLFFLTRVVLYGWGIFDLLSYDMRSEIMNVPAPEPLAYLVCGLVMGGYLLNLFWMIQIFKMATKGNQNSVRKASTEGTHKKD